MAMSAGASGTRSRLRSICNLAIKPAARARPTAEDGLLPFKPRNRKSAVALPGVTAPL